MSDILDQEEPDDEPEIENPTEQREETCEKHGAFVCEKHGAFLSRYARFIEKWTDCPRCLERPEIAPANEKNVYAALNAARYRVSFAFEWKIYNAPDRVAAEFAFLRKVNATPDQKAVGTDRMGWKNVYVPLIREGQLIGSGYMSSRLDIGKGVAELYRCNIKPEYQGKGYAKELFAALFNEAKKEGFTRLVFDSVMSKQAHRALLGMVRRGLAKVITDPFGEKRFEFKTAKGTPRR